MSQNNMVAMILAGGRGSRLYDLTKKVAKPAVHFGGKYRIIDFALSNCANSNISTVGVLVQYESILLSSYVAKEHLWGLNMIDGGVFVLPPREKEDADFDVYEGTANAIAQNIDFLDQNKAEYVLILSGDHIYKMNYEKMLKEHIKTGASGSIAVIQVPKKEASRFGIMNTDEDGTITSFEEKPKEPKSDLASMGIYIFNYRELRRHLVADSKDENSSHDFGKDIIPTYLKEGLKLHAYRFNGYWKDVGTIESLWQSNMDLLDSHAELDLSDPSWKIYTEDALLPPQCIGEAANIKEAYITQGTYINGTLDHSVIFANVEVKEGALIKDTVLMNNVKVEENASLNKCLAMDDVVIPSGMKLDGKDEVLLVTDKLIKEMKA